MSAIVETFRYAFTYGAGSFDPNESLRSTARCATVVILFVGILLFNHVERTFMDTV